MILKFLAPSLGLVPEFREVNGFLPAPDRLSVACAMAFPSMGSPWPELAPPRRAIPPVAVVRAESTAAAREFEAIVEAHYASLFRFGMSLVREEAGACDLVQQTFLKWARYGHQLRDRAKVKTWLFTTLHREFLALCRKARNFVKEEELANFPAEPTPSSSPSIDARSAVEALAQLDEVFRGPVAMFYLEEMSYAEIAEALEIPVGTVMSRLSRGRDRLRKILLADPRN